ncbi:unnamed protein product [Fraxinus pennsylvanica]|uniref:Uncharacterized protein n=1 Tax=Fraxinus pennsylvanica TaxID=56036 RepID=A0AAD2DGE9_9LAMI|nr:unnamed protein product [Fraxinus pennsylvanica]
MGFSKGYGFLEFFTRAAAENVLQTYSCIAMPNIDQVFRLNWATFSMGDKRSNNGSDLSIFLRAHFGNQWTSPYYGGHYYDGYGYAMPFPRAPSMYVADKAYPMYGTHQQQVN